MSKRGYCIVVVVCAALVITPFVVALVMQREHIRKRADRRQRRDVSEPVSGLQLNNSREAADVPQPQSAATRPQLTDSLRSADSLESIFARPHAVRNQPEQPKTQQSKDIAVTAMKEVVSSVGSSVLTGQSHSEKTSKQTTDRMLEVVLDDKASLNDRCRAARLLAKGADAETSLVLEGTFLHRDSPGRLKAAIVEGLGYSSDPEAKEFIISALQDEDEVVVRGAIRGLSAIGDNDAISELSNILLSTGASDSVALEAAMGLGRINHPGTYEVLVGAYYDATIPRSEDFKEGIIAALGQRDIAETGAFFQEILHGSTTHDSLRLAVIEAVEDAQGDTSSFLLDYLGDKDSQVRAAVAWALAVADEPGNVAGELQALLAEEKDVEVRKRLYQALGNQRSEDVDIDSVALKVFEESDLEARLAGYDLLAEHVRTAENVSLGQQFETIAIPELREIAVTADRLSTRLSAVITLKRARTAESNRALEEIAALSSDERIVKATGISNK